MLDFQHFISGLRKKLSGPLPGLESQLKMATMSRLVRNGRMVAPDDVKKAGVLILFYPSFGEIYLAFIKRTEYPGVHSGQVSFPGGAWEETDTDLTFTALREAEEEIGVSRETVTTIGKLTDLFIPPSNFLVSPIIGYTTEKPSFTPDPEEVDKVLEVPFARLLQHDTLQEKDITIFPDMNIRVPCYYVNNEVIWGATAMILNELIDLFSRGS